MKSFIIYSLNNLIKMKSTFKVFLPLAFLALTLRSCSKDDNPEPEEIVQENIPALDAKVASWMTTAGMPGMTIAVSKNGKLVYKKAYGVSDKETNTPVTNESRFRMASVSKLITSAAIMKLVQNGSLTLDQKVFGTGAILGTTYGTQPYPANVAAVTVNHLLHHTSGGWGNATNDPAFLDITWTSDQVFNYTLNNTPLANAPGTAFAYSNFNYMVLARIIEKVSGKTYQQFVTENILTPSGATQTAIAGIALADRKPNEVKYYGQQGDATWSYDKMNLPRSDGAMGWMGTSTDLLRFVTALDSSATRPDILNGQTIKTMVTPSANSTGLGFTFGCGWVVEGGEWFWWGSLPGTFGILYRNANGICISALANSRQQPNPNNSLYSFVDIINYIAFDQSIPWQDIDQF
ncbi:class A beta-lactamase-related serine hydrolase [Ferruginibacter sp. HRS2-29]|nr:class A beta-lactamase-related serine hydrolase [Ferruginibacter sp. HRS2-29]